MNRWIIKNGTIITDQHIKHVDILIENEKIIAVDIDITAEHAQIYDAKELLVFPGLIDPHVHLREPGGEHKEDVTTGTQAALAGGFTTVLAMPNTSPAITTPESLSQAIEKGDQKAVCDFGLFIGATHKNTEQAPLATQAVGLKMYMGSSTGDLLVADIGTQIKHFQTYPGVIAVHAEDEETVAYFEKLGQRRPPICASLAVSRVLILAKRYNTRLHICHVSTAQEITLIRDAKKRGVQVTCEVTPHHLFLDQTDESRLGALGRMNPPLRSQQDVAALWDHLDVFDCIATDHAPHTQEEKQAPTPPAGVPGLETALPLMLTHLLGNSDMQRQNSHAPQSLCEIARLMSTGPAQIYNLPDKGQIAAGYDADLTFVDPTIEWTVENQFLHTKCGWSPFAGQHVRGKVTQVFLRGQKVFDQEKIIASPGYGTWVK